MTSLASLDLAYCLQLSTEYGHVIIGCDVYGTIGKAEQILTAPGAKDQLTRGEMRGARLRPPSHTCCTRVRWDETLSLYYAVANFSGPPEDFWLGKEL